MIAYCPLCSTTTRKLPNGFWRAKKNRLHYLRCLGQRLEYEKVRDWYRITVRDFCDNRGGSVLTQIYHGSPQAGVQELYPNYDWKPWKFRSAGNGWWKFKKNRRHFILSLQNKLKIDDLDEWYQVSRSTVIAEGGWTLFKYIDGVVGALKEAYPRHHWHEWLFPSGAKRGFFRHKKNRLRYLRWLEARLGWTTPSDWFAISADIFRENSGGGLLNSYYRNSPIAASVELYPELEPRIHEFKNVPKHHWKKITNRRRAAEAAAAKLCVEVLDDWYGVRQKDLRRLGFHGLMKFYEGSVFEMTKDLYPGHCWLPWKFGAAPNSWWKCTANRLEALRYLRSELGYTKEEDWYQIRAGDFQSRSLGGLLVTRYDNSPYLAVAELYPQYPFLPWRFRITPRAFELLSNLVFNKLTQAAT